MIVDRVTLAYFSPTGTTRRVLETIIRGVAVREVDHIDLTLPDAKAPALSPTAGTLVLLGAPVYAGRVPETAVARLRRLHGEGAAAVLVVVYGNRAFEDALLELWDLAQARAFVPVAGAAFIGEHSYSTPETPIAVGRPNAADLTRAAAFGQAVRAKLARVSDLASLPPVDVPGARPYRPGMAPSEVAPVTDGDLCTLCGACAQVCPVGAIRLTDRVLTDGAACTLCCACVKACPTGARRMTDAGVLRTARWLASSYGTPQDPELYL